MIRLFFSLCFLFAFQWPAYTQSAQGDNTIDILKHPGSQINHRFHDVEIVNSPGVYAIHFYVRHAKNEVPHGAKIKTETSFNKASYKWESKNKVAIRLFDTTSGKDFSFKVWVGKDSSTGMEVEDSEKNKI